MKAPSQEWLRCRKRFSYEGVIAPLTRATLRDELDRIAQYIFDRPRRGHEAIMGIALSQRTTHTGQCRREVSRRRQCSLDKSSILPCQRSTFPVETDSRTAPLRNSRLDLDDHLSSFARWNVRMNNIIIMTNNQVVQSIAHEI